MSRAGKHSDPLTLEEKTVVFEEVNRGSKSHDRVQQLLNRYRNTVTRACGVVAEFEARGLTKLDDQTAVQIADDVGYASTSKYVTDLFADWRVWKSQQETRRLSVSHLLKKVWLPDADDMPIRLFIHRSGFNSEPVQGRDFSWQQQGNKVVRCWFTEVEEQWLVENLQELSTGTDVDEFNRRYQALQQKASAYATRAARYLLALETGQGRIPIRSLYSAIADGTSLDHGDPEIADSLNLMREGPALKGVAAAFVGDLMTKPQEKVPE